MSGDEQKLLVMSVEELINCECELGDRSSINTAAEIDTRQARIEPLNSFSEFIMPLYARPRQWRVFDIRACLCDCSLCSPSRCLRL